MRQSILIAGIVVGIIASLFFFCATLIDWVQDYQTGVYAQNHFEVILETAAIVLYAYCGIRFLQLKVKL
ncbi:hypothetical protein [Spirosoma foliorum]|uniref:Uncharacterized protein n=1 Tax=Spirosoma foliorum TaxID=2710596 RepID=A0A7G5GYA7_9BACT|nr:hypothetical protein [Spirosoma foliorum]QMW03849.1 hypothetical protein H3H32_02510 [Spirosoma foliorum]